MANDGGEDAEMKNSTKRDIGTGVNSQWREEEEQVVLTCLNEKRFHYCNIFRIWSFA